MRRRRCAWSLRSIASFGSPELEAKRAEGDQAGDVAREHRVAHPMLVNAPPPDREQERAHERER